MGRHRLTDEERALRARSPKKFATPAAPTAAVVLPASELKMDEQATGADQLLGGPPHFLAPDDLKVWNAAAPTMVRLNLLQAPDAIAFARYCQWLTRYIDLEKKARGSKGPRAFVVSGISGRRRLRATRVRRSLRWPHHSRTRPQRSPTHPDSPGGLPLRVPHGSAR